MGTGDSHPEHDPEEHTVHSREKHRSKICPGDLEEGEGEGLGGLDPKGGVLLTLLFYSKPPV